MQDSSEQSFEDRLVALLGNSGWNTYPTSNGTNGGTKFDKQYKRDNTGSPYYSEIIKQKLKELNTHVTDSNVEKILDKLTDPYQLAQILLLGSITSLIASSLMEFGDSYAKEKLLGENDNEFSDKGAAVLSYIGITLILGVIPSRVSRYLFSEFPYPEVQSLTFSIIVVWFVIHMEVEDWKWRNISTDTYGEIIVISSSIIFISLLLI